MAHSYIMDTMILQLDNIGKLYHEHFWSKPVAAVKNLTLQVGEGEIVGFAGPNGAGKTTTIKMIMGLVAPTSGAIHINGMPVSDPETRNAVAFVTEQPYFYEYLTVAESLRFMGELKGLHGATLTQAAGSALERVGLWEAADRTVRQLSKGMQQRLNFAQALLGDPRLYIFDEPMSGLDPPGRTLFREIFRDLHRQGKSIFFSTHILDDIESLCTRVVVLSQGAPVYDGRIDALLKAGFEGTDLITSRVSGDLNNTLLREGFVVDEPDEFSTRIFIPCNGNVAGAQEVLARHGLFCTAINRRIKSLERLLYTEPDTIRNLLKHEGRR